MQSLQNTTRSVSIGEAFIEDRELGVNDKDATKELIKQANAIDIITVFKHYGINMDEYNKKCICPFSFHSNERTPSFMLYKDTNSFFCFGCKSGGGPVNFVSINDNISKYVAAKKLLSQFNADINLPEFDTEYFIERQNIIINFSDLLRTFTLNNLDDNEAFEYREKVSSIFDTINFKHNLDTNGIKSLINKLQLKLEQYKIK